MKKQSVVIVGGGFGGIKAALELAGDARFRVTLISDREHFLYYPALYATATGGSRAQSIMPLKEIFEHRPSVKVVNAKVTGIDTHRRHIITDNKKHYDYDKVILALGVVTSYFGLEGLDEFSYSIKSKVEIDRFKKHLHDMLTSEHHLDKRYVVVGAGPTGVELAAALASYLHTIASTHKIRHTKARVSIVEAADRILPRMSQAASRAVHRRLTSLGVTVKTKAFVKGQDDDELFVNGSSIKTQTVIWTSGVSNHPFFAAHPDIFTLEKSGRVRVDDHLVAHKDIYVIGDNAATKYTGMAQTALHDAKFVAKVLKSHASHVAPPNYKPRLPATVIPVGHNWAIFEWNKLHFGGVVGSLIRRAADVVGYLEILPMGQALRAWRAEYTAEEECSICRQHLIS